MDPRWDDLRLLVALVEAGSMSAAARRLGVGQATMSRRIAGLETSLGHRLVQRSRRGVQLTPAGERLLPHVRAMQASAERLRAATEAIEQEPRGPVRVAMPPGVVVDLLIPLLQELRATVPHVRIVAQSSAHLADLDDDAADLAVRFVRPTSGDLVCRKIGTAPCSVQASPAYVAGLGPGATLADLDWITWPTSSSFAVARWLREALPEVDPVLVVDDFLVQREAALAGLGAIVAGQTRGLVTVPVPAPPIPDSDVFVVVRRSLADVPRVRAVADWIAQVGRRLLQESSQERLASTRS